MMQTAAPALGRQILSILAFIGSIAPTHHPKETVILPLKQYIFSKTI
jgi:hypothetical protein